MDIEKGEVKWHVLKLRHKQEPFIWEELGVDEHEEEICICIPKQGEILGEEESENVEERPNESLKNHWRNLAQRARRKASAGVERPCVF